MPESLQSRIQMTGDVAPGGDASVNRQRAALRELLALSAQCARREQEIDARYEQESRDLAAQRLAVERELSQRLAERLGDAHDRQARRLKEIETEREQATARHRGAADGIRRQIEHDTDSTEQDLKQQLQHAIWLADSLLEGAQSHARHEHKKIVEQVQTQLETIDQMDARARELMTRYRQTVRPAIDADDAAQRPDPPHAGQALTQQQREVEENLRALGLLSIPKLFISGRPFVIAATICALAALAAQALSAGLPPRSGLGIQWKIIGITTGAALIAMLLLGAGLWAAARSQVARVYQRLDRARSAAHRAAEVQVKAAADTRHRRISVATQHRDKEAQNVTSSVQPKLQNLARKRQATIDSAQADMSAALEQARGKYESNRAEVQARHDAAIAEMNRVHEQQIRDTTAGLDQRGGEIQHQFDADRAALEQQWVQGLARIQSGIDGSLSGGAGSPLDWSMESWRTWEPPTDFAAQVRFGKLHVDVQQLLGGNDEAQGPAQLKLPLPDRFSVPALLAFPRQASLLIQTDAAARPAALRALQMVMTRLLTSVPAGRVRFTIIDPVGLGQNFAGFMHLADHDEALVGARIWTDADHIDQRMRDLTEHMETVIQKYLRNEYETIDDYNAQAGELAEPYRFLVIADFPTNFSPEAIRRLNSIASAGARCGVYTLVMRDLRQPLPGGSHLDELEQHSVNLVRQGDRFVWKDEILGRFPLTLDGPPDEALLTRILDLVGRSAKDAKRVELPFESIAPASQRAVLVR